MRPQTFSGHGKEVRLTLCVTSYEQVGHRIRPEGDQRIGHLCARSKGVPQLAGSGDTPQPIVPEGHVLGGIGGICSPTAPVVVAVARGVCDGQILGAGNVEVERVCCRRSQVVRRIGP